MQIIGLQKFTLIDYPDKLACTVFFGGCNYRCGFCYNPELVLPERIKEHTPLKPREVFKFLKERKSVLEGVCIGGGEPTCQNDLPAFCRRAKKLDYLVKLDSQAFLD